MVGALDRDPTTGLEQHRGRPEDWPGGTGPESLPRPTGSLRVPRGRHRAIPVRAGQASPGRPPTGAGTGSRTPARLPASAASGLFSGPPRPGSVSLQVAVIRPAIKRIATTTGAWSTAQLRRVRNDLGLRQPRLATVARLGRPVVVVPRPRAAALGSGVQRNRIIR